MSVNSCVRTTPSAFALSGGSTLTASATDPANAPVAQRRWSFVLKTWALGLIIAAPCGLQATVDDRAVFPRPPPAFEGSLEPAEADSTSYFAPRTVSPPAGAPNILLVLTDDVGFGAVSTFGGPVPKPHLDRLAQTGLIYNHFHTAGICSPTRAALLTGRNHHRVGMGFVPESPSPYPGYHAMLPDAAASVARVLRDHGYSTAMFGKEHTVPVEHLNSAGPFHLWPTGRGFEHFFGFMGGDTDQFRPALYLGTERISSEQGTGERLLDAQLVDHAIRWLHRQQAAAPDKPFFIYYAPGTAHAPQQAPRDWIEQFRGRFDQGWDAERERTLARQKVLGLVPDDTQLADRPLGVPAWDSLAEEEQRVYARFMEVYAAMVAYQDHQFGRLLDELERLGLRDNTLIVFIEGDNGTAGDLGEFGSLNEIIDMTAAGYERRYDLAWLADNLDVIGGPDSYPALPAGWSYAMSTPFPWFKQIASHLGAIRNGMVVSWPEGIEASGDIRAQYHHVIDVMPTLLEVAGIGLPERVDGVEQWALDGKSMAYSFGQGDAPSARATQHYEIVGNRAIYHDGWMAGTTPSNPPWMLQAQDRDTDPEQYEWELYDLRTDFSQSRNLAEQYPDRLAELQVRFDEEARRNRVYPLQNASSRERMTKMHPDGLKATTETVFWGPDIQLDWNRAPPIFFRSFTVDTEIDVPEEGADGVLLAAGSHFGGWSFYLDDGRPVVVASRSPQPGGLSQVSAPKGLPAGSHRLVFNVDHDGEGAAVTILLNVDEMVRGIIERRPSLLAGLGETIDSGRDTNVPVVPHYRREQGAFTGHIDKVTVRLR